MSVLTTERTIPFPSESEYLAEIRPKFQDENHRLFLLRAIRVIRAGLSSDATIDAALVPGRSFASPTRRGWAE